jgi:glycosyltransferase involved in cell wall biosynthesis
MTDGRPPRVAVLWAALSGYHYASLQALQDHGAELLVYRQSTRPDAPFDLAAIEAGVATTVWSDAPDEPGLERALDEFEPDAVVVCSWHIGGYRRAARRLRGKTLRIVTFHNQWIASPKQLGGMLLAPWVLRPTYDVAFVCDERQAIFANKLGFPTDRQLWGVNTCDHPRFAAVAEQRKGALPPKAFLFVGRLVADKAIDVLAAAYRDYRSAVADPWPLLVAGTGPDAALLQGQPGVDMLGFVQPDDLPDVYAQSGCLVLPSRFEPWAIAIHEAAAAGLPVVCTAACGASTRLVLDGYNGAVIPADNAAALARALGRMHGSSDEERRAMGVASESLAEQYTPDRWATNLLRRIPELRVQIGLDPATAAGPKVRA